MHLGPLTGGRPDPRVVLLAVPAIGLLGEAAEERIDCGALPASAAGGNPESPSLRGAASSSSSALREPHPARISSARAGRAASCMHACRCADVRPAGTELSRRAPTEERNVVGPRMAPGREQLSRRQRLGAFHQSSRRFDPPFQRFDPPFQRFDPRCQRFDPTFQRFDPPFQRFDPPWQGSTHRSNGSTHRSNGSTHRSNGSTNRSVVRPIASSVRPVSRRVVSIARYARAISDQ